MKEMKKKRSPMRSAVLNQASWSASKSLSLSWRSATWPWSSSVTVATLPSPHSMEKRAPLLAGQLPQQPGVCTSVATFFSARSTTVMDVAGVAFCTSTKRPLPVTLTMPR